MPHFLVEYSDNLAAPLDHSALLTALHGVLARTGEFKEADIKIGRAMAIRAGSTRT